MSKLFHRNSNEEIVEVIIRDSCGGKIDTFKCSMSNFKKVSNMVMRKYGSYDKDLDWLK